MKIVYADVVFVVNFCVDFTVLYLTACVLYIKRDFLRLFVSAFLGGIYSVVFSIFELPEYLRIITLVLSLVLICVAAFGKKCVRSYMKIVIMVLCLSMVLFGLMNLMYDSMYNGGINAGVVLVYALVFCLIVSKGKRVFLCDLLKNKIEASIISKINCCNVTLLCDSGNLLLDPYSGLAVILIDEKYKEILIAENENVMHVIPIKTVSGTDYISVFTPERVFVCGKEKTQIEASVGFVKKKCFINENVDGIVPGVLLSNI